MDGCCDGCIIGGGSCCEGCISDSGFCCCGDDRGGIRLSGDCKGGDCCCKVEVLLLLRLRWCRQ